MPCADYTSSKMKYKLAILSGDGKLNTYISPEKNRKEGHPN